MMSIISWLPSILKNVLGLVDELHVSDEERQQLKNSVQKMENDIAMHILEYEKTLLTSKASVIKAEAESESKLTSQWRPITMLTLLALVVLDSFQLLPNPLAPEAWVVIKIGLGGYVVGRSAQKVAKSLKETNNGTS